jgi:hypothetical protein
MEVSVGQGDRTTGHCWGGMREVGSRGCCSSRIATALRRCRVRPEAEAGPRRPSGHMGTCQLPPSRASAGRRPGHGTDTWKRISSRQRSSRGSRSGRRTTGSSSELANVGRPLSQCARSERRQSVARAPTVVVQWGTRGRRPWVPAHAPRAAVIRSNRFGFSAAARKRLSTTARTLFEVTPRVVKCAPRSKAVTAWLPRSHHRISFASVRNPPPLDAVVEVGVGFNGAATLNRHLLVTPLARRHRRNGTRRRQRLLASTRCAKAGLATSSTKGCIHVRQRDRDDAQLLLLGRTQQPRPVVPAAVPMHVA